jgi:two-component system sensor histidine kinase YesM
VLQPLAENAIKHGIETAGEAIHLAVFIYRSEGTVFIEVRDNGQGFSPQAMDRLQRLLGDPRQLEKYDQLTQVGLLNVNYRLGTYYNVDQTQMTIANVPGGGAVITIIFPEPRKEATQL